MLLMGFNSYMNKNISNKENNTKTKANIENTNLWDTKKVKEVRCPVGTLNMVYVHEVKN